MKKITKIPQPLKAGDEIRIVAPASAVEGDYLENTVLALEKLGYQVTLGKSVKADYHQFAGTDVERLIDFQDALDSKTVKAIFCARGGYGSVRIISELNFDKFFDNPKWLVGFSDISVFHLKLNCGLQVASLHSPMPVNHDSPFFTENLNKLDALLKGEKANLHIAPHFLNKIGVSDGNLVGGNLSIIYSLQSTTYEIETENCILFIEDVGEQLYHLDRMLMNLKLSGKLSALKGLVAGGFSDMKDKKRPFGKSFEEIILDAVSDYSFPVIFNFPAGHIENNHPFVLGAIVQMSVTPEKANLQFI